MWRTHGALQDFSQPPRQTARHTVLHLGPRAARSNAQRARREIELVGEAAAPRDPLAAVAREIVDHKGASLFGQPAEAGREAVDPELAHHLLVRERERRAENLAERPRPLDRAPVLAQHVAGDAEKIRIGP